MILTYNHNKGKKSLVLKILRRDNMNLNMNYLITFIFVLFLILVSIQYTLNQILKVLKEIRKTQLAKEFFKDEGNNR